MYYLVTVRWLKDLCGKQYNLLHIIKRTILLPLSIVIVSSRREKQCMTMIRTHLQIDLLRFGWHAVAIDGHDMQQVMRALDDARKIVDKPIAIIAKTFKGHGVNFVEDKNGFHGKALTKDDLNKALDELAKNFPQAATYHDEYQWKPKLPNHTTLAGQSKGSDSITMPDPSYKQEDKIATRKAYGQALAALGTVDPDVISLDGEVKNSTLQKFLNMHIQKDFSNALLLSKIWCLWELVLICVAKCHSSLPLVHL